MTLTHQGDLVGVAAEGCYVLFDPVQRGHEVEQSVVSRRIAVLRTQETFQQTVITASSPMSCLAKLVPACSYDEMLILNTSPASKYARKNMYTRRRIKTRISV